MGSLKKEMFVTQFQGNMKISVNPPVIVRDDNVGSMFMISYITTTSHTKNINIMYKCINEYVEDRAVKIILA